MKEFLENIFLAVVTAVVPVLTAYFIALIRRLEENADVKLQDEHAKKYIEEAMQAVVDAVVATNQTYVDALKKSGKFDAEAQKAAAQKALNACLASISDRAQRFLDYTYGDIKKYLTTRIEAEVRKQKGEAPATLGVPVEIFEGVRESTDTTTIAAAAAAATAAAVVKRVAQAQVADCTVEVRARPSHKK